LAVLALLVLLAPLRARAVGFADSDHGPWRVVGSGSVTDASHPRHPGDFYQANIDLDLRVRPDVSEAVIELQSGEPAARDTDVYYVRRGRIFQINRQGGEIVAAP